MTSPVTGMLDTSTAILLGRMDDPTTLPDEAVISAITLAELSVGSHAARNARERAARQAHLQQAESDFDVLAFDGESARAFGGVAAAGGTRIRRDPAIGPSTGAASGLQLLTPTHIFAYRAIAKLYNP